MGSSCEIELVAGEQIGELHAGAAGLRTHLAVGRGQIGGRHVEPLRAKLDQRLARGRGGLADLHAAALDAVRAGGAALVGGERGVALDQLDALDRDAKLLGEDLAHGDAQPGAEIDLAAEQRDGAVAVDAR